MANSNLVYGECLLCGMEGTMTLTDAQKAVYDELRAEDADAFEYKKRLPEFTDAQIAFLWQGLCPAHAGVAFA